MAHKTVQVEVTTYQPRSVVVCDGPGCLSELELREAGHWRRVNTINSALGLAYEFHFCSMKCLADWSAEAYAAETMPQPE